MNWRLSVRFIVDFLFNLSSFTCKESYICVGFFSPTLYNITIIAFCLELDSSVVSIQFQSSSVIMKFEFKSKMNIHTLKDRLRNIF